MVLNLWVATLLRRGTTFAQGSHVRYLLIHDSSKVSDRGDEVARKTDVWLEVSSAWGSVVKVAVLGRLRTLLWRVTQFWFLWAMCSFPNYFNSGCFYVDTCIFLGPERWLKSTGYPCRGPRFNTAAHKFVTSVPENPVPSSALTNTRSAQTYVQVKHPYTLIVADPM